MAFREWFHYLLLKHLHDSVSCLCASCCNYPILFFQHSVVDRYPTSISSKTEHTCFLQKFACLNSSEAVLILKTNGTFFLCFSCGPFLYRYLYTQHTNTHIHVCIFPFGVNVYVTCRGRIRVLVIILKQDLADTIVPWCVFIKEYIKVFPQI